MQKSKQKVTCEVLGTPDPAEGVPQNHIHSLQSGLRKQVVEYDEILYTILYTHTHSVSRVCLCVCVCLLTSQEVRADDSASEELLTFHEAVLNLREAEDALVEHHKEIVEESERWLAADRHLVALVEGTESNTDGVCAAG